MTHSDSPPLEPQRIGPYRILDALGVGGMGIVYLAEQSEPVRRRVALKVVKRGMDTAQVLARFESERQALAVMDHPNIARVLDGGVTEDGRPYFAMELVRGTPITDYADTHRLTTAERLRLFIDVCRAVQHAHQKGVIHRDIKPSNVLVTVHEGGPVVKVIDFGIAKAVGVGFTEDTIVTRAGQILGTPEYMSPEQAEMSGLDVDTRTDIYSLGVLLYELTVGTLPFDLRGQPDYSISHTLREREPPRPSTRLTSLGETLSTVARYRRTTPEALRREVRGDLDWIILKAMAKDRTRRYDTATGMAMDVERHLRHEPVVARPPSARDRIAKFVRRNRPAVVAGAVAALAILGGATAATIGFVEAREAQLRAERSAVTAEQVTEFLVGLFRVSSPGEARGTTVTAREVLDRGADRIRTELADQPLVQARLTRTIGTVYRNLGLYDAAAELHERAVALHEGYAAGEDPAELVRTLQALGIVYRMQGRSNEAETALRRAVDLARSHRVPETVELASTMRSLGNLYQAVGRYGDAEGLLREALSIQERLLGTDHPDVGLTAGNLGAMYLRQRHPARAEAYLQRSLRITERTYGPSHVHVAAELSNLGSMHSMAGRSAEAEAAYLRAYDILTLALDAEHPSMAGILHNLGEASHARGDYAEAESRFARALGIKERALGPEHASVALTLRWLGNVHRDQGHHSRAEPLYVRALGIYERTMERPDPSVRETLEDFARLLRSAGRLQEAEALERRAAGIPLLSDP